jgi:RNA polymerase sigma-70 factor (ECF subfamily)
VNRTGPATPPIAIQPRVPARGSDAPTGLDPDSSAWVARLDPASSERDAAVEALHRLLLDAARFEIDRRRRGHPELDVDGDLARQAAADALVHLLRRLEEFRGQSRFTTWALKFAIVEAAASARRACVAKPRSPAGAGRLDLDRRGAGGRGLRPHRIQP